MTETQLALSCNACRYWAPNIDGQSAQEGVCRKLAESPTYFGSLLTEAGDKCEDWARLGVYEGADGQNQSERRAALRTRIDLPAKLHTVTGDQLCRLADISELGAGLYVGNPPLAGTPGVLKWYSYEVFFTVAWADKDSCGVMFDVPISGEVVIETIRLGGLKNNRHAEPSRIAQGQKRARLCKSV